MSVTLVRHKLSVDSYERMVQAGILAENDRVELIRGDIIEKMPINPQHGACVKRLNRWFTSNLGDRVVIGVQDPIRLHDSEPEPDLSIMQWRDDQYGAAHPQPEDILLLIEVADSSLDFDREIKLPLYAEAGVVERRFPQALLNSHFFALSICFSRVCRVECESFLLRTCSQRVRPGINAA